MLALFFTKDGPGVRDVPDPMPLDYCLVVYEPHKTTVARQPWDRIEEAEGFTFHKRWFRRRLYTAPVSEGDEWRAWARPPAPGGQPDCLWFDIYVEVP